MTKVTPTAANARIVCAGGAALTTDFTGVIRQQDVRAHEVDKVRSRLLGCVRRARVPWPCARVRAPNPRLPTHAARRARPLRS